MSFIQELQGVKAIMIQQKTDWIQIVPCCQVLNQYQILKTNYDFTEIGTWESSGQKIGVAFQNSVGPVCQYCCKMFRKYDLDVRDNKGQVVSNGNFNQTAIKQYKPCCVYGVPMWACLGQCKPVSNITRQGKQLGTIQYPVWCGTCPIAPQCRGFCSALQLDIKDQQGNVKYYVTAPCLNPGFLCGFAGGIISLCQRRQYKIQDSNQSTIGKIENIYHGILLQCCSRADRFGIHFPINATVDDKIRLIQACLMIDYIQYGA